MNLNAIKETSFHKDKRPDLIRQFGIEYADSFPWVYVSYIESAKSRDALFYFCSRGEIHPVYPLVDYLEECGELKSLQQTALALDTFYQSGFLHGNFEVLARLSLIVRGEYDASWLPHPVVDSILMESNGLLIWNDQLERLLGCAGVVSLAERVQLRKHLNQKHPGAWEQVQNLLLPDGLSLEHVMDERMLPLGCTSSGNWRGAALLYHLS